MKYIFSLSVLLLILLASLASCSPQPSVDQGNSIGITVSILPEKYFVDRIGGSMVSVNVMVGPGDSPHTYEPKPEQMTAISHSDIYFSIGVEFENAWLDRIASANPNMKIVDLSANIEKLPLVIPDNHNSGVGESDPHIWTSPALVKVMAEEIFKELTLIDPDNTSTYKTNFDNFISDLDSLDKEIRQSLEKVQNRNIMVFHPGWAYFARDYNINEISIEIGGTEPSASELAQLIDIAKKDNIKIIFAQPELSTQIAKYIAAEIGGKVVLISPLSEDWLNNLRQAAQVFKESF